MLYRIELDFILFWKLNVLAKKTVEMYQKDKWVKNVKDKWICRCSPQKKRDYFVSMIQILKKKTSNSNLYGLNDEKFTCNIIEKAVKSDRKNRPSVLQPTNLNPNCKGKFMMRCWSETIFELSFFTIFEKLRVRVR